MYAVVRDGNYQYARVIAQDELRDLVRNFGDYAPRVVAENLPLPQAEALAEAECERARRYYSN